MTEDELEELAIKESGIVAYRVNNAFIDGLRNCSELTLQTHFLQMVQTICATSLSLAISDICRIMGLDAQESLAVHKQMVQDVSRMAEDAYQIAKKQTAFH